MTEVKQVGLKQALVKVLHYFLAHSPIRLVYYVHFVFKKPKQMRLRFEVVKRFKLIQKSVHCAHSEFELLHIADNILRIPSSIKGDIIECGVYKGGSTCKLSVVAKLTNRKLLACDSFQGLPEPQDFDKIHTHCNGKKETYKEGDYEGSIQEVQKNLERFGEPAYINLVPGWFNETLPRLDEKKFVLIFLDVDLYDSIITCLENLWTGLQPGMRLYTHEAHHELTIKAFTDAEWWQAKFNISPPAFIGGGTGLSWNMKCLGYVQKPKEVSENTRNKKCKGGDEF